MAASEKGFLRAEKILKNRFTSVNISKTNTYATVRRGARLAS
jgi:hypothetical protein